MTYPEIVHAQLQKIINLWLEYEQHYSKEKRLERMRMITLADVINALIYFEGGSLDKELKRAGLDITSSAFIQRRHQIVSTVLQDILADFSEQNDEYETFQGYRVCAIDGSSINIPRNPLARTFIQHPGAPNGYNQLKVHALYDVLSKTYLSAEIHPQPEQDEITRGLVHDIRHYVAQLEVIDRGIADFLPRFKCMLNIISGVSDTTVAKLLLEIGDIK